MATFLLFHPDFKESERSVMLEIGSEILVHLSSEVTMEKRYSSIIGNNQTLSEPLATSPLGIGSHDIWYGTPDIRTRGGVVFYESKEGEELIDDSGGEDSDVHGEGKIRPRTASVQQMVATCVVSSFTESKRHPSMSTLVPTILMDKKSFIICLCDCKKDILLISNKKSLCTNDHLSQSGIALLWTVLNHRAFLQDIPDEMAAKYPAGIKSKLNTSGYLKYFEALCDRDQDWAHIPSTESTTEGSTLPAGYVDDLPKAKKKKKEVKAAKKEKEVKAGKKRKRKYNSYQDL